MKTLAKPKPARKPALAPSARLAERVRAGTFAKGADFKIIAAVVDSRSSTRLK